MTTVVMLIMFRISAGTENESTCLLMSIIMARAKRPIAVVLNLSASITDDEQVCGFNGSPIKHY
jgi:hypothetical protein